MSKSSTSTALISVFLCSVDAFGIKGSPITNAQITVDDATKATIAPDPTTPGYFVVSPVKQDTPVDKIDIVITGTDPASNNSATADLEYTAGDTVGVALDFADPATAPVETVPAS